jgi:conjugative relaxase-like TrwC/TraI family protein
MLRVTTIYASHAGASADYYAKYLTQAPAEVAGVWTGKQADAFGLAGDVTHEDLLALLEGRDPVSGTQLGRRFCDREMKADKRVEKAVAGFDATFSAPKSISVLWALTQDEQFLEAHDIAVSAALAHLERFGSTTRVRAGKGVRLHPDSGGLIMAKFGQTTSRADDPDLHTHCVISNKVRTADGRWMALDGKYMKEFQRMLGGIYQSVIRNELTHRFGFEWEPIVNGQAEIAGVPKDVLRIFSKRTIQMEDALQPKLDEFIEVEGRDPSEWEVAKMTREAVIDTRQKKSGAGVADLMTRWVGEASDLAWSGRDLLDEALRFAASVEPDQRLDRLTAHDVINHMSSKGSAWNRADIMKAVCDLKRPVASQDGERWAATLERVCDLVMEECIELDPSGGDGPRRASDGRSLVAPPVSRHITSERILAEEDFIISWAIEAQTDEPMPSVSVDVDGLDVMQAEVARAVAGYDRLILAVGPAGAGKTTTLRTAVADLNRDFRWVFGVAPSAKAAHVLKRETGLQADTLAKLLHEWERTDRGPLAEYDLPPGSTVIVDESGMVGTSDLNRLLTLATREDWRLVLIGDHHQLQAVGRGGMFHELCRNGRAIELDCIHRFHEPWEAAASLQLRHGDARGLDTYLQHGRISAGTFDDHLRRIAKTWLDTTGDGRTIAITASTNEHVDKINGVIQYIRTATDQISSAGGTASIGSDETAHVGDIVVSRKNDRRLETSAGEPVRNRESWTVEAIGDDGSLTVSSNAGSGTVTLPADYASEHVRLGYASTEHGNQGDTVDVGIELATVATTQRGLYVGATRGRDDNKILVVTETDDLEDACDILRYVLSSDRSDVPATTQRRLLAEMERAAAPHRPKRTIRCSTPSWFADLRSDIADQLAAANVEVDVELQQVDDARAGIVAAKRVLVAAQQAMAPFQPSIDHARQVVDDAQQEMWSAHRRLERAGRVKRPTARREAKQADVALKLAHDRLDETRALAAPAQRKIDDARAEIDSGESSISTYRSVHHWSGNETRRDHLVQLDGALSTWCKWATGESVVDAEVGNAVNTMKTYNDDELQQPLAHLVDAVTDWSERVHPALLSQLEVEPPAARQGMGIEL